MRRIALTGVAAVLLAVACSGNGGVRESDWETATEDAPGAEPAEGRLSPNLHVGSTSNGVAPVTASEPTVTKSSVILRPPATLPPVAVPTTTEEPVVGDDVATNEDIELVGDGEGTFLAASLPDFAPPPASWAANLAKPGPEGSCKATEALQLPAHWHMLPTLEQVRAAHSEADARKLADAVSALTNSFETFLAAELPSIELGSEGRRYSDATNSPGRVYLSSEELGEQGYCNTGVKRELAISDLAAGFADSFARGLLWFDWSPFSWDGTAVNPFLTYAFLVESDPLHNWADLLALTARSTAARSSVGRLQNWRSLMVEKACHDELDLATNEFLEEMYTTALITGDTMPAFSRASLNELRRLGYNQDEFISYIDQCKRENIGNYIPPPVDFSALNRLLADELYDGLVKEFDTLLHAAPSWLTLTKDANTNNDSVGRHCVATPNLVPIEYPSSLDPNYNWVLQDLVNPVTYRAQELDHFPQWVEDSFSSGAAVLAVEMTRVSFRGPDEYHGSRLRDADIQFRDRSRLLGDLAEAGYCNEGVSRQFSIPDASFGIAFEVVGAEHGNPFLTTPDTYGAASLYYAEYTESDPLHEFVTGLKAHIAMSARAMPEWQYFKWPRTIAVRRCFWKLGIDDESLQIAYLNSVLAEDQNGVLLNQRAVRAVRAAGYSMATFEMDLADCYRTFASNYVSYPYSGDFVVAYFASRFEQMMKEWLALNPDRIPSNLVIVE